MFAAYNCTSTTCTPSPSSRFLLQQSECSPPLVSRNSKFAFQRSQANVKFACYRLRSFGSIISLHRSVTTTLLVCFSAGLIRGLVEGLECDRGTKIVDVLPQHLAEVTKPAERMRLKRAVLRRQVGAHRTTSVPCMNMAMHEHAW